MESSIGNMRVDNDLQEQLLFTTKFDVTERTVDKKRAFGRDAIPIYCKGNYHSDVTEENGGQYGHIKILSIMVGSIKTSAEEAFGRLLLSYLSDREIFTVVSPDFCHCKQFCICES